MRALGVALAVGCLIFTGHLRAQVPSSTTQVATQASMQVATPMAGRVSGVVKDADGDPVVGATVLLTPGAAVAVASAATLTATTEEDGSFLFEKVPAGKFALRVVEDGLYDALASGEVKGGETLALEPIGMRVQDVMTEVDVLPPDQVAKLELQEEEKQRLFGAIPNFYVSYDHDAPPLPTKLKYQLAWRNLIDPVNVAVVAASAGIEQADGAFSDYGRGWSGYGKRFGAGMGDFTIGSILSGAVLPQLFRQDPRYFYKGTGTTWARVKYAVAMAVVCKGDNGKWQPCYSNVLGGFGAAAASNLYYPASDRRGASLTLEIGSETILSDALSNVVQEFLLKKLTPKKHNHGTDAAGG